MNYKRFETEPLRASLTATTAGTWPPSLWLSQSEPEEKRTVRVGRRREGGTPSPGGRERAEAPQRRRAEPPPPPGGGYSGGGPGPSFGQSGGGGLPRSPLMLVILVIIVICVAVVTLFQGGDQPEEFATLPTSAPAESDLTTTAPAATRRPVLPTPTPAVRPAAAPAGEARWLVMLYQDADDKILEEDINVDLNEAERAGSSDAVHVVTQLDRYQGGYRGDGDWDSTRRFYVSHDNDLNRLNSEEMADLGETNMADGQTLVDFVTWAIQTYPADKYALIMSDHGMGWPGGWSDPTARGGGDRSLPLSAAVGDILYLMELDQALEQIRDQTGLDKFELIGMDACLMSHLEVYSALAPHARYAVASQETEPALGWAYTAFLNELQQNPQMDGAELSRLIVESYIQGDQRIVDDQARAEFTGRGSLLSGLMGGPTAAQLTRELEQAVTLTAVDLEAIPALMDSFNSLSLALQGANQQAIAKARTYAQSYTSVFGSDVPPSYIDLGNFAQLAAEASGDRQVGQAAGQVQAALRGAVIAEKHGPKKTASTGISIYFPNSQLYRSPAAGPESYTVVAGRFAGESLWDDFLAYHYTGRRFEPGTSLVAVPERGETISAPATGIEVSPLTLSDQVAAPGQPVLMSADISGENVGYVKLFVGFYDQAANSIFIADTDYLDSPETREIDGLYYPVWGEGDFTVEFEWEPVVFAINDGSRSVVALFNPQTYGLSRQEATYTVDGIYTYADGETRQAQLYFSGGVLRQVFGFTGAEEGTGSPREIIPQPGDQFTVLEKWLDLDQSGNVAQTTTQPGETLTFGDQVFEWRELDAAPGDYTIGFIVEDLDGQSYPVFDQINVQ